MDNGSVAEEALQCTGVADSIRKLTARMTILTLVPAWQKQHTYQLDNERGTCDHSCADGSFSLLPHGGTRDQIWQCYDRTEHGL